MISYKQQSVKLQRDSRSFCEIKGSNLPVYTLGSWIEVNWDGITYSGNVEYSTSNKLKLVNPFDNIHCCQCVETCQEVTMEDENGNVWKTVDSGATWEVVG